MVCFGVYYFVIDLTIGIFILGQNINKTYIGLFDGFDGNVASSYCATQLHLAIIKNISKFDKTVDFIKNDADEINNELVSNENSKVNSTKTTEDTTDEFKNYLCNIKNAFYASYKQMDKLLSRGRNEKSRIRWSGSTSVTCIIENIENKKSWLHIANCGKF